ncbi:MAG TPA: RagB/SusD family nutrient uptake outer membrane protein, partial [Pseudobacter sp.]|nr:RagB/SusD family nutrient uptake outer membrane protein [Pseudobacter sp.]
NMNEYYMVMRLSELYLIRAEASILLSASNITSAINDLNELRGRSNASLFPPDLTVTEVTEAIASERRRELFAEWGHRWLDLKRTGKAREVLSAISYKQPWKGDYQLLYPIPVNDLRDNPNLKQNEGYINL